MVQNGRHYGRVAFGYRLRALTEEELRTPGHPKNARMIESDPLTREVAVEVFARVDRGESMLSAARWLVSLPAARRGNRYWSNTSVSALLRSPTYVARPHVGVEDVLSRAVARWEPLISDEMWARVQQRLSRHARRGRYASGNYLLTGFIRCPRCDSRMGVSASGGKRFIYRCLGGLYGANAPIPHCQHAVSLIAADHAALDQVGAVLSLLTGRRRLPALQKAWLQMSAPKTDTRARRLAELERALAASQRRLSAAGRILFDENLGGLQANWRTHELVRDEEVKAIELIESERAQLRAEAKPTAEKLPPLEDIVAIAGSWSAILDGVDVADQRAMMEPLVDSVRLKRIGWGKYIANITWTKLGQLMTELTSAVPASAA